MQSVSWSPGILLKKEVIAALCCCHDLSCAILELLHICKCTCTHTHTHAYIVLRTWNRMIMNTFLFKSHHDRENNTAWHKDYAKTRHQQFTMACFGNNINAYKCKLIRTRTQPPWFFNFLFPCFLYFVLLGTCYKNSNNHDEDKDDENEGDGEGDKGGGQWGHWQWQAP